RLNERIGALLDFARPFEPVLRITSLNEIAERALHGIRQKAAGKGVSLTFEASEDLPPISVDPVLFEEAAAELISNAIEITPAEGSVTVRTGHLLNGRSRGLVASAGSCVWLEVTDTGPGFRLDKRDRLFDIFFTTKPGGTGFGLATVKKIVERHGGSVSADNVKPTGAKFRIELPVREGGSGSSDLSEPRSA
ncbi:MAG: ATP-binding protein, partial [Candidatus Binatia bacterium]